ncbi:DUF1398 domain-containing protein [Xanthobacter wiegelii]|uniref:hypothetical protein n=1 Tax=Xanthobacter wiegelii TaxID=3119913 RepID=UPI00372B8C63
MTEEQTAAARACLAAAESDTATFPAIVGALIAAGFESYAVDFRPAAATYYLPSGDSLELPTHKAATAIAPALDDAGLTAAIREAQQQARLHLSRLLRTGGGGRLRRLHRLLPRPPRRLFRPDGADACGAVSGVVRGFLPIGPFSCLAPPQSAWHRRKEPEPRPEPRI